VSGNEESRDTGDLGQGSASKWNPPAWLGLENSIGSLWDTWGYAGPTSTISAASPTRLCEQRVMQPYLGRAVAGVSHRELAIIPADVISVPPSAAMHKRQWDTVLYEIAEGQSGYFTAAQAKAAGMHQVRLVQL
jgi:hypothetical protein